MTTDERCGDCGMPGYHDRDECVPLLRKEIEQLKLDLAQQTANAKTALDLQREVAHLRQTCASFGVHPARVTDDAPEGCTRSHPHEEMNAECKRLTEAARSNALDVTTNPTEK